MQKIKKTSKTYLHQVSAFCAIASEIFYFKVCEISQTVLPVKIYFNFLGIEILYLTCKSISVATVIQAAALHSGAFKLM